MRLLRTDGDELMDEDEEDVRVRERAARRDGLHEILSDLGL